MYIYAKVYYSTYLLGRNSGDPSGSLNGFFHQTAINSKNMQKLQTHRILYTARPPPHPHTPQLCLVGYIWVGLSVCL